MNSVSNVAVVAYVASPHAGYLKFFRNYPGATLYVLGSEFIAEHQSLTRHLPGNAPEEVVTMIGALHLFEVVTVLTPDLLPVLEGKSVVMPDEDVSRAFAEKYLPQASVSFDSTWRLRWDWQATHQNMQPSEAETVSCAELDRALMGKAMDTAKRSPDWWRQVGALLSQGGQPLLVAFNSHQPSEQSAYLTGDPRSNFGPGERIDASLSLHAEVGIIAEAAKRGIRTAGCDLYVTTFPCPPCAYACANAGIARLFYAGGYSLLAGADALQAHGVEIVRVDMTTPSL